MSLQENFITPYRLCSPGAGGGWGIENHRRGLGVGSSSHRARWVRIIATKIILSKPTPCTRWGKVRIGWCLSTFQAAEVVSAICSPGLLASRPVLLRRLCCDSHLDDFRTLLLCRSSVSQHVQIREICRKFGPFVHLRLVRRGGETHHGCCRDMLYLGSAYGVFSRRP